jgi:predicted metal-dependent peptidase
MTKAEEKKLADDFSWAISRLVSKSVRIINETYNNIQLIDLLMALPVKPVFKEIELSEMKDKDGNPLTMEQTAIGGFITRDTDRGNPNRMIVHLVFSKDKEMTWDNFFNQLVHTNGRYFQNMVAFVYMHEAMHILMKHFDYYLNQSYYSLVSDVRPEFNEDQISELLNHAFDYWINAYLLEKANSNSTIASFKSNPDKFSGLYDANLSPNVDMTQQEIVRKLAEEAQMNTVPLMDADGNQWGEATTITINGNSSTTITIDGNHAVNSNEVNSRESNIQEIGEVLDNTRRDLLDKSRGSGSVGGFSELGVDYSVPVDWFKYLKSSLFTLSQKYTSTYDQTWSKLKNKMRHIAPMPGRIHYEKEMAVVVSIDQSGSMSDSDLEKINYVVTQLAKKSVFTEVLLHDTSVAERKRFQGKKFKGIRDFVTHRVAFGGTSHREVFDILREIKDEKKTRKIIYLSFSDNFSDIEQVYDPDTFDNIPAYWIVTSGGKSVDVPGMQISLEDGLLQH